MANDEWPSRSWTTLGFIPVEKVRILFTHVIKRYPELLITALKTRNISIIIAITLL